MAVAGAECNAAVCGLLFVFSIDELVITDAAVIFLLRISRNAAAADAVVVIVVVVRDLHSQRFCRHLPH
jgi:hypothetical protein